MDVGWHEAFSSSIRVMASALSDSEAAASARKSPATATPVATGVIHFSRHHQPASRNVGLVLCDYRGHRQRLDPASCFI
jgi:hypothetical protein